MASAAESHRAHPGHDDAALVDGDDLRKRRHRAGITGDHQATPAEPRHALPIETLHHECRDRGVRPDEDEVAVVRLADRGIGLVVAVVAERHTIGSPHHRPVRGDTVGVDVQIRPGPRVGEGQHAVVLTVADQIPTNEAAALRLAADKDTVGRPERCAGGIEAL
jgi:hypothetical protein